MRLRLAFYFALSTSATLGVLVAIGACSAPTSTATPLKTKTLDGGSSTNGNIDNPEEVVKPEADPLVDGSKPPGKIYAHTKHTLYLFEPLSKVLSQVGDFSCVDASEAVVDIALDKAGKMFGTTFGKLLSINPADATCTVIHTGSYPNSLGFVPKGTVDDNTEALVGYVTDEDGIAARYVRIDIASGGTSIIPGPGLNPLGATVLWKSSGDIIGLIRDGNRAFLTVRPVDVDASGGHDRIAEIDPKTGTIISIVNDTQHDNLYGLAQWAGTGYGFSAEGEIVQFDLTSGIPVVLQVALEDGGPATWYGAGVTTDSPTKP